MPCHTHPAIALGRGPDTHPPLQVIIASGSRDCCHSRSSLPNLTDLSIKTHYHRYFLDCTFPNCPPSDAFDCGSWGDRYPTVTSLLLDLKAVGLDPTAARSDCQGPTLTHLAEPYRHRNFVVPLVLVPLSTPAGSPIWPPPAPPAA